MNFLLNPNRIVKKTQGRLFSEEWKGKKNTRFKRAAWPSGLRRGIQAPIRKGEGSNPSAVKKKNIQFVSSFFCLLLFWLAVLFRASSRD